MEMKHKIRYESNGNENVSKSQVIKAVRKFFNMYDVLSIEVKSDQLYVVEWDGICCTKWIIMNMYDFINAMKIGYSYPSDKYEIIDTLY